MKKILLTIIILIQNTGYAEQYADESLKKNKDIPAKQCKCILFEKNNLIINFTDLNKPGNYLISATLASDKNYWTSFFCVDDANENSKAYHCIGDDDAGRLWVKSDEKGLKVKFGNIRLDSGYNPDIDDIESKYIISEDKNYMQGKCVPCL
jgi:hypothetical protein